MHRIQFSSHLLNNNSTASMCGQMVTRLLQEKFEEFHADHDTPLPPGVSRLTAASEITQAREDRKKIASGGSPKDSSSDRELKISEEAELHSKVILPASQSSKSMLDQFQEFKEFQEMMNGASRKRSREEFSDDVTRCRSSSSYDTISIDVEDDVTCPDCKLLHRHALNYCPNCGSKLYN